MKVEVSQKNCIVLPAHNNGLYCGNKIVVQGEDCDCGRPTECQAVDKCCVARDDKLGTPECTVRPGMQCRLYTPCGVGLTPKIGGDNLLSSVFLGGGKKSADSEPHKKQGKDT